MTAADHKKKSEIVKINPPIRVPPTSHEIGKPVWCGNEACEEYLRRQEKKKDPIRIPLF